MQGGHPLTLANWAKLAKAIVGCSFPPRWAGKGEKGERGTPGGSKYFVFARNELETESTTSPHEFCTKHGTDPKLETESTTCPHEFCTNSGLCTHASKGQRQGVTLERLPLTLAHNLCNLQLQAKDRRRP